MRSSLSLALVLGLGSMLACARIAGLDQGGDPDPAPRGTGSQSTPQGATIRPAQMTLTGACGATTESDPITIENGGGSSLPYTIEPGDPKVLAVLDASGNVVPKLTGDVPPGRISAGVKVRVVATDPGPHPTTVVVTVGDTQRVVDVGVTIEGGTIAISSPFDFGQVRQQTTSAQDVAIRNTGTTTVTIDRWDGQDSNFSIAAGTTVLAPGEEKVVQAKMSAAAVGPAVTATLLPHTLEGLCGPPPTLELKGQRVNTDVTVTGTVSFGDVDCGASAGRPITITNYAQETADYELRFPADSFFSADAPVGTVPPAQGINQPSTKTINLLVGARSTPGDNRQEVIPVAFRSNGAASAGSITATTRIRGALLDIQPTTLSFTASNPRQTFNVTNTGNQFVYVALSATNGFSAVTALTGSERAAMYPSTFPTLVQVTSPGASATGEASTTRTETPPISIHPRSGVLCAAPSKVTLTRR